MSNRFVRSSKFRHVFGTPAKREKSYDNLKISKSPHESNMSSVNEKFFAVVLESQGGGAFIVIALEKVGRVDINHPKVSGHKSSVLDIMWNPFNDNQIASASEDCTIKLWDIPDGGLTENMNESVATLEAHQRKVTHIQWHPSAENVLASAGADHQIIVWNTETGDLLMQCEGVHGDLIQSISWDYCGSRIATTCKDKKIRVIDARTGDVLSDGQGHTGTKPSRVVFCGQTNKLFTTGFSRMSDRQYALWDPDNLDKSLTMENIDTSSGVQFPFWDDGTEMVYLVGKGDTQIRYFEVKDQSPYVHFLSMYQGKDPYRSACVLPKRFMDCKICEVMRFFLLGIKGQVDIISMTVPRKSEMFQEDLYPDCPSGEPALSADEWFSGVDKDPILMSLGGGGGSGGASTGTRAKTVTAVKKSSVQKQSVTASAPAAPNFAGRPEPTTLEEPRKMCPVGGVWNYIQQPAIVKLTTEALVKILTLYRKAYKELEAENRQLKEKLGMAA